MPRSSKLITAFIALLLAGSVLANPDPVREKLTRTADLTPQEVNDIMVLYGRLYLEMQSIRYRPTGYTTAQHRNLLKDAYRRHRQASLKYLKPNEYRKWMTVAGRVLPRVRTTNLPEHDPYTPNTGDHTYSPAIPGLRYE